MAFKLIGVALSPYVRKVRVALAEKSLDYEHDPMVPFGVSEAYKRMHPLGKVPTFEDGERVIPDSSAILVYLEAMEPEPALFPSDAYERARAVWLEELADTGLANGCGAVFQERFLAPRYFGRAPDETRVGTATGEILPPLFDYLERALGDADWLVGGRFSVADLAVGSQLANLFHAGVEVDASRWPALAAWAERTHARPSFKALLEEERPRAAGDA